PWAIDFGDGVHRHPTQIYEIIFLAAWGALLWMWWKKDRAPNGQLFRVFVAGYLAMRFAIEFIKPTYRPYLGLSAIQVASLFGCAIAMMQLKRSRVKQTENARTESAMTSISPTHAKI